MSAAYTPAGSGSPTEVATYVYDAFGNQIEEDATIGGVTTVTREGFDGWNPASADGAGNGSFDAWADLNGSDALVTRRVYGPGADELTARESAGGTVGWYLTDDLGSIRGITDGSGTPLTTIGYDAFGDVTADTTPAAADQYGYAGVATDPVTGLESNGNGAGEYNPALGRFNQQDPTGFGGGDGNLYRYTGNDPLTMTDPSGQYTQGDELPSPGDAGTGREYPLAMGGSTGTSDSPSTGNGWTGRYYPLAMGGSTSMPTSPELTSVATLGYDTGVALPGDSDSQPSMEPTDIEQTSNYVSIKGFVASSLGPQPISGAETVQGNSLNDFFTPGNSTLQLQTDENGNPGGGSGNALEGPRKPPTSGQNGTENSVPFIPPSAFKDQPPTAPQPTGGFLTAVWSNVTGFADGLLGPRVPTKDFKPIMLLGPSIPTYQFEWNMLLGPRIPTKDLGTAFENGQIGEEYGQAISGLLIGRAVNNAIFPKPVQPIGKGGCFPGGTPVATADGPKSIEALIPGDRVWAFDFRHLRWRLSPVLKAFRLDYNGIMTSITAGGHSVTATGGHPFWVEQGTDLSGRPHPGHAPLTEPGGLLHGRWVLAQDLRVGDVLVLRTGGGSGPVEEIASVDQQLTVYNVRVAEYENYAVGRNGALAHNQNTPTPSPNPPGTPTPKSPTNPNPPGTPTPKSPTNPNPPGTPTAKAPVVNPSIPVTGGVVRPIVTDVRLNTLMDDIYKPKAVANPLPGTNGGTADSIRWTKRTGQLVRGSDHIVAGKDRIQSLKNWLRDNPLASEADRQAAQAVITDLENALAGN
ncbi:Rhs family protein [Fimbriiglobus ruber]|uniref:Rhs family protein n=1 Tax=Fimbriiglobus ruber TaxID=1908690 RepID=A0A225DDC5_9BACT|nr:Rhs family protein [Fimbriiglobus ruber]